MLVPPVIPFPPQITSEGNPLGPIDDTGVTILNPLGPSMYEPFEVTPLDETVEYESRHEQPSYYDPNTLDSLAGNVRPDNVMRFDE